MASSTSKKTTTPALTRFSNLTTKTKDRNACWLFSNAAPNGYGVFHDGTKTVAAHRYAFEQSSGRPIPAGMCVCHKCDDRRCVNPDHLFLSTKSGNSADMKAKGRSSKYLDRKPRKPLAPTERALVIKMDAEGKTVYAIAQALDRFQPHIRNILKTEAKRKAKADAKEKSGRLATVISILTGYRAELETLIGEMKEAA